MGELSGHRMIRLRDKGNYMVKQASGISELRVDPAWQPAGNTGAEFYSIMDLTQTNRKEFKDISTSKQSHVSTQPSQCTYFSLMRPWTNLSCAIRTSDTVELSVLSWKSQRQITCWGLPLVAKANRKLSYLKLSTHLVTSFYFLKVQMKIQAS